MQAAAQQPDGEADAADLVRRIFAGAEVKPESLAALHHALYVAEVDGVGGTLVIRLPRKRVAPVEVTFTTGNVSMRIEP